MLIGLTYDLRQEYLAAGFSDEETGEFDRPDTVAAIEAALGTLGHETSRIGHARQLVARLAAGDRWDLVFNIAEGLAGVAREAQIPAILDVYGIACTFSDPLVMALTLHKGLTKTVVAAAGIPTPAFAVVESTAAAERVELPYPLFAKPVAEGTGKGVSPASKVRDRAGLTHGLPGPAGQARAAGVGGNLSPRPRVHRRHHGHWRRGPRWARWRSSCWPGPKPTLIRTSTKNAAKS